MNGKLRNMASIYIINHDKMLLLYRIGSSIVAPSWCPIGGHFEEAELNDARACVLRELEEELRLRECDIENLELRYLTLRLKNNEIRQGYYFFADLKEGTEVLLECNEGIPSWFPFEDVNDLEMPFTAQYLLQHYMTNGRYTDALYGGIATENGVVFTELKEF